MIGIYVFNIVCMRKLVMKNKNSDINEISKYPQGQWKEAVTKNFITIKIFIHFSAIFGIRLSSDSYQLEVYRVDTTFC